jgi:hypothetical protein
MKCVSPPEMYARLLLKSAPATTFAARRRAISDADMRLGRRDDGRVTAATVHSEQILPLGGWGRSLFRDGLTCRWRYSSPSSLECGLGSIIMFCHNPVLII